MIMSMEEIEEYIEYKNSELNSDSRFRYINLTMAHRDNAVGLQCEFCDVLSNSDKATYVMDVQSVSIQSIDKWIEYVINGVQSVNYINNKIKEYTNKNGYRLKLEYKWGNKDRNCKILDWDSNRIVVRLSKDAIENLIIYKEDFIAKLEEVGFIDEITKFVEMFDSLEFHKIIGAELATKNVADELSKYMLRPYELDDIVNNMSMDSDKDIKTVFIIDEIGLIATVMWHIKIVNQLSVEVEILGRVLDYVRHTVVNSQGIYDYMTALLKYKALSIQEEIAERR